MNDIEKARIDFNAFAEYVGRDYETGEPFVQALHHKKWAERIAAYPRYVIRTFPESGATTQLAILRTVWELGRDQTLRIMIVENTSTQAVLVLKHIRNIIKSATCKKVFPSLFEVKAERGGDLKDRLFVDGYRRPNNPSVKVIGVGGVTLGSRVDRLVLDRILNHENVNDPKRRMKPWLQSSPFARLTKDAKVVVIDLMWSEPTFLNWLDSEGWPGRRYPVAYPTAAGELESLWPEVWPDKKIAEAREILCSDFARVMMCQTGPWAWGGRHDRLPIVSV